MTVHAFPQPEVRLARLARMCGPSGEMNAYLDAEARSDFPQAVAALARVATIARETLRDYVGPETTDNLLTGTYTAELTDDVVADLLGPDASAVAA